MRGIQWFRNAEVGAADQGQGPDEVSCLLKGPYKAQRLIAVVDHLVMSRIGYQGTYVGVGVGYIADRRGIEIAAPIFHEAPPEEHLDRILSPLGLLSLPRRRNVIDAANANERCTLKIQAGVSTPQPCSRGKHCKSGQVSACRVAHQRCLRRIDIENLAMLTHVADSIPNVDYRVGE